MNCVRAYRPLLLLIAAVFLPVVAQADCQWTAPTGTSIMYTSPCAKVGIGTTTPAAALQVTSGSVFITGDSGVLASSAGAGVALKYWNGAGHVFSYDYGTSAFKNLILQVAGGNVGIGTVSPPQQLLHVGTGAVEISSGTSGSDGYANRVASLIFSRSDVPTTWLNRITNSWSGYQNDSTMNFEVANSPTTYATPMTLTGNGRVGVGGLASPLFPLDVNGYIRTGVMPPNDTTPAVAGLHFSNRGPGGGEYRWSFFSTSPDGAYGLTPNGLELYEYPNNSVPAFAFSRMVIRKAASTTVMPFVIDGLGHVGVGVWAPSTAYSLDISGPFHASGDAVIDGNIAAKYQDVAEWVPASAGMEPGTVVVLNREKTNEVTPSSTPYDTGVAGVVSARPGVILGESSPSKARIATTGRLKVRVDASKGPIRIGDLLVTSDQPGMAMRSEPVDVAGIKMHRPGTLIGKALEPLASGKGEILVLLSLQ